MNLMFNNPGYFLFIVLIKKGEIALKYHYRTRYYSKSFIINNLYLKIRLRSHDSYRKIDVQKNCYPQADLIYTHQFTNRDHQPVYTHQISQFTHLNIERHNQKEF